jgi:hypothetical protein
VHVAACCGLSTPDRERVCGQQVEIGFLACDWKLNGVR